MLTRTRLRIMPWLLAAAWSPVALAQPAPPKLFQHLNSADILRRLDLETRAYEVERAASDKVLRLGYVFMDDSPLRAMSITTTAEIELNLFADLSYVAVLRRVPAAGVATWRTNYGEWLFAVIVGPSGSSTRARTPYVINVTTDDRRAFRVRGVGKEPNLYAVEEMSLAAGVGDALGSAPVSPPHPSPSVPDSGVVDVLVLFTELSGLTGDSARFLAESELQRVNDLLYFAGASTFVAFIEALPAPFDLFPGDLPYLVNNQIVQAMQRGWGADVVLLFVDYSELGFGEEYCGLAQFSGSGAAGGHGCGCLRRQRQLCWGRHAHVPRVRPRVRCLPSVSGQLCHVSPRSACLHK